MGACRCLEMLFSSFSSQYSIKQMAMLNVEGKRKIATKKMYGMYLDGAPMSQSPLN